MLFLREGLIFQLGHSILRNYVTGQSHKISLYDLQTGELLEPKKPQKSGAQN